MRVQAPPAAPREESALARSGREMRYGRSIGASIYLFQFFFPQQKSESDNRSRFSIERAQQQSRTENVSNSASLRLLELSRRKSQKHENVKMREDS